MGLGRFSALHMIGLRTLRVRHEDVASTAFHAEGRHRGAAISSFDLRLRHGRIIAQGSPAAQVDTVCLPAAP
jgi:hypothetical protein